MKQHGSTCSPSLRRSVAFQWFFTAFSVRPRMTFAMSAHLRHRKSATIKTCAQRMAARRDDHAEEECPSQLLNDHTGPVVGRACNSMGRASTALRAGTGGDKVRDRAKTGLRALVAQPPVRLDEDVLLAPRPGVALDLWAQLVVPALPALLACAGGRGSGMLLGHGYHHMGL